MRDRTRQTARAVSEPCAIGEYFGNPHGEKTDFQSVVAETKSHPAHDEDTASANGALRRTRPIIDGRAWRSVLNPSFR
jgi:hypothetical protein